MKFEYESNIISDRDLELFMFVGNLNRFEIISDNDVEKILFYYFDINQIKELINIYEDNLFRSVFLEKN